MLKKNKEEKSSTRDLVGKTVVTKGGKTLGRVSDLLFEVRTGELLNLILQQSTGYAQSLDLEVDTNGRSMIPFGSVLDVQDFVVCDEESIL